MSLIKTGPLAHFDCGEDCEEPMSKADVVADFMIDLMALGFDKPEYEFKFHPTRKFRFDLAWPDQKLALEIDGGTWTGGRHTSGAGYERDCIKLAEAMILGWDVVRVTMSMIRDGTASDLMGRLRIERLEARA